MSTELTTFDNLDYSQIAALTGANVASTTTILPKLGINWDIGDDEKKPLPMGAYTVTQGDNVVYSKQAPTLRPFINAYQYSEYSPTENKFLNKSIIIKSFNEEALDEKGGVACGKVSFKNIPTLSANEQIRQKNIKCRRLMYGLVTLQGVTAAGEKAGVENLPVLWKLSGSSFMAPNEAFASIEKMKHLYFQHNLSLASKREKNGSTVYYTPIITVDLKNELHFSDEDMASFKLFQSVIDQENRYVIAQWKKSKQGVASSDDKELLSTLALDDDISDL